MPKESDEALKLIRIHVQSSIAFTEILGIDKSERGALSAVANHLDGLDLVVFPKRIAGITRKQLDTLKRIHRLHGQNVLFQGCTLLRVERTDDFEGAPAEVLGRAVKIADLFHVAFLLLVHGLPENVSEALSFFHVFIIAKHWLTVKVIFALHTLFVYAIFKL